MITMGIGLFAIMVLAFFLGGGAVGWLLRGLRKCECECAGPSMTIDELIADLERMMKDD